MKKIRNWWVLLWIRDFWLICMVIILAVAFSILISWWGYKDNMLQDAPLEYWESAGKAIGIEIYPEGGWGGHTKYLIKTTQYNFVVFRPPTIKIGESLDLYIRKYGDRKLTYVCTEQRCYKIY